MRAVKKIVLFLLAFILTGCAIKDDDTTSEKFLKHTANAPMYVILGAGLVATEVSKAATTAIMLPPYMIYKKLNDTNSTENNETNTSLINVGE